MECSVCMEMDDRDNMYELSCGHWFHSDCIIPWLRNPDSNGSCPNCRNVERREETVDDSNDIVQLERERKKEVAKALKRARNKSTTKEYYNICKLLLDQRLKKRILVRDMKVKTKVVKQQRSILQQYSKSIYKNAAKQINAFAESTDVYSSTKQLKSTSSMLSKALVSERFLEQKLLEL